MIVRVGESVGNDAEKKEEERRVGVGSHALNFANEHNVHVALV